MSDSVSCTAGAATRLLPLVSAVRAFSFVPLANLNGHGPPQDGSSRRAIFRGRSRSFRKATSPLLGSFSSGPAGSAKIYALHLFYSAGRTSIALAQLYRPLGALRRGVLLASLVGSLR